MFEHHRQPLISQAEFLRRSLRFAGVALGIILVSLSIGMLGYFVTEDMTWVDAFVNASMILGGMGPVNELHTQGGKIFAGIYALYSGVVFLLAAGVFFAPAVHRVMHSFHLDLEEKADDSESSAVQS